MEVAAKKGYFTQGTRMDKHVTSRPRIAIMLDESGVTCVVADTDVEVVAVDKHGEYTELTGKVIEPQVFPLASFRQSSAVQAKLKGGLRFGA